MNTYILWGKVRKGQQRGRQLGFPTANIMLHKQIPEGIYVSLTKVKSKQYQSITFIGAAKTFGQIEILAETYILSFNKNIYGQWVTVHLLKKLRANQKFENADTLVKQMKKDEEEARKYFSSY